MSNTSQEGAGGKSKFAMYAKLYLAVLLICIVSELIGIHKITIGPGSVVLLPMLYAVIIGILITPEVLGKPIKALKKIVSMEEVEAAGPIVLIALLPLGVKYGTLVGPNIVKIIQAGPAFLLQELGNVATPIIACLWLLCLVLNGKQSEQQ